MAVDLLLRKNGWIGLACFSIHSMALAVDLLVDGFHALLGQRTCVRDLRLPTRPLAALRSGSSFVESRRVEHAAWSEPFLAFRILGIVGQLRFFLSAFR